MIVEGDDGWVFLVGGSNHVGKSYSGEYESLTWIDGWANILKRRIDAFNSRGIKYIHVVAPEKLSIYKRFLPEEIRESIDDASSPARMVYSGLNDKNFLINPTDYLIGQSYKMDVYHKTDSHWNFYGAFSVYQLIMHHLGLPFDNEILKNIPPLGVCVMDLGGKLNPPVSEEVFFYSPRKFVQRVWVNEMVEYKERNNKDNEPGYHVGSSVEFVNNDSKHDKSILIFGDSFSEYRPQLLTGLLAETFRRVRFVWSQNIDYSIVDEFGPDVFITETAERFMPYMVPEDRFNLDEYVKGKLSG